MVDFIGIGAQKCGTSWIYACLYEHPEICAPIKEIHFFSRPRFEKGKEWYESHFSKCVHGTNVGELSMSRGTLDIDKVGEFSTSYLYSKETPARIKAMYPNVMLIAVVRNPLERAYSQYRNAIKAGEIGKDESFDAYVEGEPSALEQGRYAEQLARYYELFPKTQILTLVYEDSRKDPSAFIKTIYEFLGVDATFVPSMLLREVNIARTPKFVFIDRTMHHIAESLRRVGFDKLVFAFKKSGLPDMIRGANTDTGSAREEKPNLKKFASYFHEDTEKLSEYLERDMVKEWGLAPTPFDSSSQ
jgi:hypothetical protein